MNSYFLSETEKEAEPTATDNASALPVSAFKVSGSACLTRDVGQKNKSRQNMGIMHILKNKIVVLAVLSFSLLFIIATYAQIESNRTEEAKRQERVVEKYHELLTADQDYILAKNDLDEGTKSKVITAIFRSDRKDMDRKYYITNQRTSEIVSISGMWTEHIGRRSKVYPRQIVEHFELPEPLVPDKEYFLTIERTIDKRSTHLSLTEIKYADGIVEVGESERNQRIARAKDRMSFLHEYTLREAETIIKK